MKTAHLLLAAMALASAGPASAGIFRAYLSIDGNDANPCTVAAPCRLLPAALAAVDPDGEVWMLDSANYNAGPVQVDKSVTLLAVPGALGSLVANGGPALTVVTPAANVNLRNLSIRPLSGSEGEVGLLVQGAGIRFGLDGSDVSGFGAAGGTGLRVSATATGTVTRSRFSGNDVGIDAAAGGTALIADSRISGGRRGVVARVSRNFQTTSATVERSTLTRVDTAVVASVDSGDSSTARVLVTDSFIAMGDHGVDADGRLGVGSTAVVEVARTTIYGNGLLAFIALGSGALIVAADNLLVNNPLFNYEVTSGGSIHSAGGNRMYWGGGSGVPVSFPRF